MTNTMGSGRTGAGARTIANATRMIRLSGSPRTSGTRSLPQSTWRWVGRSTGQSVNRTRSPAARAACGVDAPAGTREEKTTRAAPATSHGLPRRSMWRSMRPAAAERQDRMSADQPRGLTDDVLVPTHDAAQGPFDDRQVLLREATLLRLP